MDINEKNLEMAAGLCRKDIEANGPTIEIDVPGIVGKRSRMQNM